MARPLRLEYAGALYHVTARGDRQEAIFLDDEDRHRFLELLGKEVSQQGWICYAYCLMDNHYHLLIETPEPNLVRGMRRLNGVYTQAFNRRHGRAGHVFQGRYKAILVDKDSHLLELCRYIVLNPARAKRGAKIESWPWSSYLATAGKAEAPGWLAADKVRGLFRDAGAYRRFVAQGQLQPSPWRGLRGQIYLGGEEFLARMQRLTQGRAVRGIARAQLRPLRPGATEVLRAVARAYGLEADQVLDRGYSEAYKAAVYLLRRAANLPLVQVAEMAGISAGRVSQIQAEMEHGKKGEKIFRCLAGYKLKP